MAHIGNHSYQMKIYPVACTSLGAIPTFLLFFLTGAHDIWHEDSSH